MMTEEFITIPLIKNDHLNHFELHIGEYQAFIEYKERPSKIWLTHTESAPQLAGQGAATAVIEKTLHYLKEHHYTLFPLCPLVYAYIEKHPEWKEIVDPSFEGFMEDK
ncbi:N-acetyltransferase [Sphingobacterium sp. SRCM116780]|uniref:GNAT family N-acetyltransferase n=1 Tax=Sphingobacterium sp. SRCM116780 TaxID=2907623 RepID=UPI001F2B4692|nr:GNAT family N-acetyltransferase [Sphingobacterium sp. SRCM116780]UIR56673.1 N-acetyltransferase [Sphingobacterium sp. SRCM116780]